MVTSPRFAEQQRWLFFLQMSCEGSAYLGISQKSMNLCTKGVFSLVQKEATSNNILDKL